MISKCPNCGGELRYDIEDQMVVCDFCGQKFSTGELHDRETDEKGGRKASARARKAPEGESEGGGDAGKPKMKVTVFTCPNCGGEIISTDLDAVDYCNYCGSFVSLESHLTRMREPDFVIPFKVTGEECRSSYKRFARKRLYAPSQLRDDEYLERFRSIYIPYWMYDVGYGSGDLKGTSETRKGNYVYRRKFDIKLDMDAKVKHIPYDASSTFDDTISEAILPFDPDEMEPFSTGALLGHFADTADVPPGTYAPEARAVADEAVRDIISKIPMVEETDAKLPSRTDFTKKFGREVTDTKLAMLPVWFLTWRRKDRIAYSVVNGATGEISAEMPISTGKFLLGTLLLAVPLFFLFNLLFMITATKMMLISSLLTCVGVILYFLELREIVRRETHVYDKGYLRKHPQKKQNTKGGKKTEEEPEPTPLKEKIANAFKGKDSFGATVIVWIVFTMIGCIMSAVSMGVRLISSDGPSNGYIVALVICDIVMVLVIRRARKIAETISYKKVIPDVLGSIIAIAIAHVIAIWHPAEDLYYYITAILGLIGVVMTMLGIIRRYNAVVTRPLPHFFDRRSNEGEGAKPQAKAPKKAADTLAVFLIAALLITTAAAFTTQSVSAAAYPGFYNRSTHFEVLVMDDADLLTDSEEYQLVGAMRSNTKFGNAVFLSSDSPVESTAALAADTYKSMYGSESGSIFVVDMYNRYLYIFSDGLVYKFITKSYANTITDNVYRYATKGDYYTCAMEVFSQELKVLNGVRIAQPMKYVDNVLLALIASLFLNYLVLRIQARRDRATQAVMMESSKSYLALISAKYFDRGTTKIYSPPSSSSSGGSSGGGGGGGGGGGSSGGGGGHGF
ncbi:MAG: TPM domain-containing protein [Clostridia bacterium]|nr:TPM domain-containing protein [Clostridia bacterium]